MPGAALSGQTGAPSTRRKAGGGCRHVAWSEGGWPFHRDRREGRHPDLGKYWGDSLGGAVGPLVGYFLCRGVEGGGGPTIISILASKQKETPAQCTEVCREGAAGAGSPEQSPGSERLGGAPCSCALLPPTPGRPLASRGPARAAGTRVRGLGRHGPRWDGREWPASGPLAAGFVCLFQTERESRGQKSCRAQGLWGQRWGPAQQVGARRPPPHAQSAHTHAHTRLPPRAWPHTHSSACTAQALWVLRGVLTHWLPA